MTEKYGTSNKERGKQSRTKQERKEETASLNRKERQEETELDETVS